MDQRLRALLADRFKLMARSEMREATVYSLVRARADRVGPQLKPSAMDCRNGGPPYVPPQPGQAAFDLPRRCTISTVSDGRNSLLRGGAQPLDELAPNLAVRLAVPVTNKTGLTGVYDFDLRFTPDAAALSEVAEWPTLMTAIKEQLGLTLEAGKAPIEFIVIDHVERPSAN
jgi:uncharacterized protein (TIGR03435 family)